MTLKHNPKLSARRKLQFIARLLCRKLRTYMEEFMQATNKIFGSRLKLLRENAGLRQEDVGQWLKMQKSTVSQWEKGRFPHVSIIAILADKFGVSVDYLLGRYNTPKVSQINSLVDAVISRAENISLSDAQKNAFTQYKNMPINEQQQRLNTAIEKIKSLPVSDQEALVKIIDSLHSH